MSVLKPKGLVAERSGWSLGETWKYLSAYRWRNLTFCLVLRDSMSLFPLPCLSCFKVQGAVKGDRWSVVMAGLREMRRKLTFVGH